MQYAFIVKAHHEEITNHPKHRSNIEPFLDLHNWSRIEFPTVISKNNYAIFEEKKTPKIALTVFYFDLKIDPVLLLIHDDMLSKNNM